MTFRKNILPGLLITLSTQLCCGLAADAQQDSARTSKFLDSVTVIGTLKQGFNRSMPEIRGVLIFAGKKSDAIDLNPNTANLSQNLARSAYAKIPGLNIWEMDGAGVQLNVGTRGSDPHRSIEMNIRQNGYITNSDIVGYPENHYTPPMQAVSEVQLVRGSAALQFGSQFGGMLNLEIKQGDSTRPLSVNSEQTVGSNNFFNSYNAVGGTIGKINYYTYYDNRHGDGWRSNAHFNYQAGYAGVNYRWSKKGTIGLQYSRMQYVEQIAGGQTDAQFYASAKQSNRSRNYFSPEINIAALLFNYTISKSTQLQVIPHFLWGERNSVQFIAPPYVNDTANTSIGSYNPRQVDRDHYSGFTTEARLLHHYVLGKITGTITTGIRYFNETTRRRQKGKGTTAADFDLSLLAPYGIDLAFHSVNYAAFAENIFRFGKRFSLTPGLRYENIQSNLNGVINNAGYPVTYSGNRRFMLLGIGSEYKTGNHCSFYANWSQAYRPYLYAAITPADRIDQVDPQLQDSRGYDMDLGYRGILAGILQFDVNAFYLFYGNRVGLLAKPGNNGPYLYTTNIGDAVSKGVEAYAECSFRKWLAISPASADLRLFNSFSYTHARYTSGKMNNNGNNIDLNGNRVEGTPDWINRSGARFIFKTLSASLIYSYVGDSFNDAKNTAFSSSGAVGRVPAYHVWDFAAGYAFRDIYYVRAGINNIADRRYFTRRITFYPGPGILPADGRSYYLSFGVNL